MKLALRHLGTEFAPRLCIFDTDNGKYWGGDDWTEDPKQAELFTDFNDAFEQLHLLMIVELPGTLFTFNVPLVIEVKSRDEISVETVKQWINDNLQLGMNGSGPENAMAMVHLDVSEIKDISCKITIDELRTILYPSPVEEADE